MAADRHIIRKVSLEVDTGSADPFRFQREAVAWAREGLMQGLEEIFANLPPVAEHIVLDRLEIALDAADGADWRSQAWPRLKAELTAALMRQLRENGDPKGAERLGPARSFIRKLAFYLEHGVFPWNLRAEGPGDLAAQAEAWLAGEDGRDPAGELAVAWKLPSSRIRFREAFSPSLAVSILIRSFGMREDMAAVWSRDAARIATAIGRTTRADAWPIPSPGLPPALLEEILHALSHNPRLFAQGVEEELIQAYLERILVESGSPPLPPKPPAFESDAFALSWNRLAKPNRETLPRPRPEAPAGSPSYPPGSSPGTASGSAANPATPSGDRPPAADGRGIGPAVDGVHIAHAGLILAAPFLSMLFQRVGLAEGDSLKDPATALALLHYLPTGREGPAEYQLPLAKVLCGIPFAEAISLPSVLDTGMKQEADRLLESMIEHWAVLKDTTAEGLRDAFLRRPGKLSLGPRGDWLLQVEQKAYDMLLLQLPWSFQLIRLPWMPKVLRTEWAG